MDAQSVPEATWLRPLCAPRFAEMGRRGWGDAVNSRCAPAGAGTMKTGSSGRAGRARVNGQRKREERHGRVPLVARAREAPRGASSGAYYAPKSILLGKYSKISPIFGRVNVSLGLLEH